MDGPNLKAALKDIGVTQRWLADQLGLAYSTVSDWARGDTPVPQYAIAYLDLLRAYRIAYLNLLRTHRSEPSDACTIASLPKTV